MENSEQYSIVSSQSGSFWKKALPWLAIPGGWLLLTLITTGQWYLTGRPRGEDARLLLTLSSAAAIWAFWAGAVPVIFWLGRRLPLRRGNLTVAFLAHFAFAFGFGFLHLA
jgi:hypothetical protein